MIHGGENLPSHDRYPLVSNHSGMGVAEVAILLLEWPRRFPERRLAGMAHPAVFRVPWLGRYFRAIGAVPAVQDGAEEALTSGAPLLLFPGGDYEAMRPVWQARMVDFNGRKGWIRLARKHGLTIVPMCIQGSHVTLPIVLRSRVLAWITGMRFLGVRRACLSLVAAIAWIAIGALAVFGRVTPLLAVGLGIAAFWIGMILPWVPSKIRFNILPPIDPEQFEHAENDDAFYANVLAKMQKRMNQDAVG